VGACDLDLTFQLDAVVGEPRLNDLDRVVDAAGYCITTSSLRRK